MRFNNVWSKPLQKLRSMKLKPSEVRRLWSFESDFVKSVNDSIQIFNPIEVLKHLPAFAAIQNEKKYKNLFKLKAINQAKEYNKNRNGFGKDVYDTISKIDESIGYAFRTYPILYSLHLAPIFHFGYSLNENGRDCKVCLKLFFFKLIIFFFFKFNFFF